MPGPRLAMNLTDTFSGTFRSAGAYWHATAGGEVTNPQLYLGRTTAGHPFVKVYTKSIGSYKINLYVRGSIAKLDS